MIGDVLGSYRVVSRLGAGGMGTVWLAEHQLLGSRAAIKVLLPDMSVHPKIVQRFFDEARSASRIQDPGIVRVLDFGWHEQRAYLVMEHLAGETLADRIARLHVMPPLQAVRLLQQCAIAMAAAHARGIVHRDLKPDNIFLVPDAAVGGGERIKILDFGIAKLVDDTDPGFSRTQTGLIMGTPAFMSPEQCRAAGGIDHRTDVYALGCVLFMMLCGRPPFIAPTAGDMIASHLRQDPPVPSSLVPTLTPEIDALVLRCLEKPPEHRFQTMTELVRAGAQITGDNLSIETIAPLLATTRPAAAEVVTIARARGPDETVATAVAAPVNTTLGNSSGEAVSPIRPWRGGLVVAAAAIAVIGVIAFVMTRDRPQRGAGAPAPSGSAAAVTIAIDASVPDAAIASAPDAGDPRPTVRAVTPPTRVPPVRPATVRKPPVLSNPTPKPARLAGSGSSGSGSGSGSGSAKPYDPFADR
jgi:serine/threonine-protein kinase